MLKICIVSILFINFAACSLERGVVDELDFYFSWEQFAAENKVRYCQHPSGKIYPFTDYRQKKRNKSPDWKYRKTHLYVGTGVIVDRSRVDRSKVNWLARSFRPDEGQ